MARARISHNDARPPRRLAWGTFTCSRQEDLAPLAPPPETRARDLGEHSARGRYVGQHVPTEATRHPAKDRASPDGDVNVFERPMRTEKQNTQRPVKITAATRCTSPAQSAPFTRRHGLSRSGRPSGEPPNSSFGVCTFDPCPEYQPCPTRVDHAGLAVIQGRALAYRTRTQCAHPGRAATRPCRIPRRDRHGLALLPSRGTYFPTRPCSPARPTGLSAQGR